MRIFARILAVLAVMTAVPGSVGAVVLSLSGSRLEMRISNFPNVAIAQSPEPLSGVLVSSGAGSFSLNPGLFGTTTALPYQLFSGIPLIDSLNMTVSNAGGTFAPGDFGFGGSMPLTGRTVIILGGLINLSIPLSVVGVGGVVQNSIAALHSTITGAAWTTGVAQVTGITTVTPGGLTLNTVTLSGYDNRTAGHRGTLQLVTPIRILTNSVGSLPSFSILTLSFVPEPGIALLIGSAALLAAWTARRKS